MHTFNGRLSGDVMDTVTRLEALAADIRRLAAGEPLPERNLEAAPVISSWMRVSRAEPCLMGKIDNRDAPATITSGVWIFAPEHGWVRTFSRFYRLGLRSDAGRLQ